MERARALRGELEVEVFERNQAGRAFYRALGFEIMQQKVDKEMGFEVRRLRLAAGEPRRPTDSGRGRAAGRRRTKRGSVR